MSTFQLHDDIIIRDGTYTQQTIAIEDIIELDNLFPQYKNLIDTRGINASHVDVLANIDSHLLPAIKTVEVTYKGKIYYCLIDGYHRSHAALKRGDEEIKATTVSYDNAESIITDFFESNLKHGFTATKSTRTAYAVLMHNLNPDMSISDIARHVGINKSNVSRGLNKYRGDTETKQEKARNTAKQVMQAMNKIVTLLSDYGNGDKEIAEKFLQDFIGTYESTNEKEQTKATDIFKEFLRVSRAISTEVG